MTEDQRTPQGAALREDVDRVLACLRAPDEAQRLVLPDGAKLHLRVAAVHEHGTLGGTVGFVTVTRGGVRVDGSVTTAIRDGRAVRTSGEVTITF